MATIDGHYWVEIHIDEAKRIDEKVMQTPQFTE